MTFRQNIPMSPEIFLNISVVADEDCEIVFLNVQRLLVTCSTACEHHQKLIRNLVSVLANKILILNDKITHVGKRTTRDKLLSYLSAESIRHSSLSFDIINNLHCFLLFVRSIRDKTSKILFVFSSILPFIRIYFVPSKHKH